MNAQDQNQFALLWALGYKRLVPIVPPGAPLSERSSLYKRLHAKKPTDPRGKVPGVKWPDGTWSGFDFVPHESTEDDLVRWHAMGAGVGIKTGRGLVLIDADTKDEKLAQIIRDTIVERLGELPVRIGNYPKAGYLVRTDAEFLYCRIEFGEHERVEILSEGRQFVAHGVHPGTGKPYRWPRGVPAYDDVPIVPAAALHGLLEALRPLLPEASAPKIEGAPNDVDQASLLGDFDLIRKAVEATPNTSEHFPSRESYRDFGYAIKGAAGPEREEEAFDLWWSWCERWADAPEDGGNDIDTARSDWDRMKRPLKLGASKVYEIAEQASGGKFTIGERWFDADAAASTSESQAPLFPKNLPKLFSFTSFDEAASTALSSAAKPLIKGVLDQGAMTVLYGESNAGKTFVAMDVAYHIARGMDWANRRTAAFPVLYIAAEGGQGARKRAAALTARYGPASAFWYLMHPINLLRPDADLRPLLATIRAFGVSFGLVVVDTLSRAMAGGDENASTDMGAMVKHLDVLRNATGAHLMVVHHSGKDRAKGARGHSLLRAATDTEIEVVDRRVKVTKQRDLDGGFETGFDLQVMTLGVDAEGDPVTSCTIRLVRADQVDGGTEEGRGKLTVSEGRALRAIEDIEAMEGRLSPGVTAGELAAAMKDDGERLSDNSARHLLRALEKGGFLRRLMPGKWTSCLAKKVAKAPDFESTYSPPPICPSGESGEKSSPLIFD